MQPNDRVGDFCMRSIQIDRNLSANNSKSLFARTGFFDIIMLSAKFPLARLPFHLPFSLSKHPKFPQKFHDFSKKPQKDA